MKKYAFPLFSISTLTIIFALFSNLPVYAQQPGLFIEGTVREEKTKLSDVTITVMMAGRVINSLNTPSSGLFSFTLNYNNDYVLQFSKDGYTTKRISVSTKGVPEPDQADIFEFTGFEVSLFKVIPDLDVSLLQKPVGKISFLNPDEGFDYDAAYTASIQGQLQKFQQDLAVKKQVAAEADAKFKTALAKADKAFASKDYAGAKDLYYEASGVKPEEKYPKEKITEIEKITADLAAKDAAEKERLSREKEINDRYNAAIAKADKSLAAKDYTGAKAGYGEASGVKPAEQYPKNKISEIDKLVADIAAKEEAKRKADEEARLKAEADAATKKKADEASAAKEKAISEKYNASLAKADKAFGTKNYSGAKTAYGEALTIKPSEKYPKEKISEIDNLLAQLAAQEEEKRKAEEEARKKAEADAAARKKAEEETAAKEKAITEKYNAALASADKAFSAKDYTSAKNAYTEASTIKPSEKYPQEKIAEISKILAQAAAKEASEKELVQKYSDAIARGDKAFGAKDYSGARSAYGEASGLKPAEQYPKNKTAEIDKILADIAAKDASEKALTEKYNAALVKADKAFAAKDYSGAKSAYSEASSLKPSEKLPKDKITEIDNLLAQIAAKEDAKRVAEEEARKKAESEAAARKKAEEDAKLKAEADAAARKKAEEDAAKALAEKYNVALAKGDKLMSAKDYTAAKSAYNEALSVKSAEQYPKNKIAEIEKILADMATAEATKRKADDEARLKAIEEAAAQKKAQDEAMKVLNEKYNAIITKADKEFIAKKYDEARVSYTDASRLKPGEKYPKDKLSAIDKAVADELAAKKRAEDEAAAAKKAEDEKPLVDLKEDTAKGPAVITKQKQVEGSGTLKSKGKKKKATNVVF